jgi:hypothetical protein
MFPQTARRLMKEAELLAGIMFAVIETSVACERPAPNSNSEPLTAAGQETWFGL